MDKWHGKQASQYSDPYKSPRANPKHAYQQINGETQQTQHEQVLKVRARQSNMYI